MVGQGRRSKPQGSRSNAKNHVLTSLLPYTYRSRSNVLFKVKGRGQGQRSNPNFWRAAVENRGSALPSAAKSKSHYQSKVFVCVSSYRTDAVDLLLILKHSSLK